MKSFRLIKSKKTESLPLNTVIIAILGLIVLIVLIILFREQIGGAAKRYLNIGESAEGEAKGETCVSLFSPTARKCASAAQPPDEIYHWTDIGQKEKDCKDQGTTCWERGEKKTTSP